MFLTIFYFTEDPANDAVVETTVESDKVLETVEKSTPATSNLVEAPASVDNEDDLARELEEIEGSKKEENSHTEKTVSCPVTQKTSDLIKDLESEPSCIELTASKVTEHTSETVSSNPKPIDEEVDSTTENLLKRKPSEDNAPDGNVAKKLNADELDDLKQPQINLELPTNSKTVYENILPSEEPSTMEVDDPNDTDKDNEVEITLNAVQKEEAITSTSSEVVCIVASETEIIEPVNASDASVSGSTEDDSKSKAIELPEESVSSTEDLPSSADEVATKTSQPVVDKEADSSKVEDVTATVASIKTAASTTMDKESTSTIQEIQMSDSTISMDSAAGDAIRKELRTATSDANNKIAEDLNASSDVPVASTNGDGKKKPENKLLTNMMNNGGSSTPNSYPASPAAIGGGSNVFNSTPIQKQFEVKSENVSKIDEHSKTNITTDATDASKTSDALTSTGKFRNYMKKKKCLSQNTQNLNNAEIWVY